jgi:hypothetical protein
MRRNIALGANLVLGLLLWVLLFTDISFRGTVLDAMFPPFVLLVGVLTWRLARRTWREVPRRFLGYLLGPSILAGGMWCLPIVLFALCMPFYWTIALDPSRVGSVGSRPPRAAEWQVPCPDGRKMAIVRLRRRGMFAGGDDRLDVDLVFDGLPLFERNVARGEENSWPSWDPLWRSYVGGWEGASTFRLWTSAGVARIDVSRVHYQAPYFLRPFLTESRVYDRF